jgi:hypothetical protein
MRAETGGLTVSQVDQSRYIKNYRRGASEGGHCEL